MNVSLRKIETLESAGLPGFVAVSMSRPRLRSALAPVFAAVASRLLPPLATLAILITVWQLLCDGPASTLPSPTRIWAEAHELILDPFFVTSPRTSASAGASSHRWSALPSASALPASSASCSAR